MLILLLFLFLVNADSYFKILNPKSLVSDINLLEINFQIANFGYVPYGQKISGQLEMANPYNYCNPPNTQYVDNDKMNVKILLVERGDCSNYQKAIYAQNYGYVMMVLINDINEESNLGVENKFNEYSDIEIPSIIIKKSQGELLKSFLLQKQHESVYVQILFPELLKTDKVNYEYWFSSMDKSSYRFLKQFYSFHMQMKDFVEFTPHYTLGRCGHCERFQFTRRDSLCLSGGRYCAADPDGNGPLDGQDAVREVVRQICIFKTDKNKWWNYVLKYSQLCLDSSNSISNVCYNDVLQALQIDPKKIETCYNDSFLGLNHELDDNILLSQEYQKSQQLQIYFWPILYINNVRYRGNLTIESYFTNYDKGDQEIYDSSQFGPFQAICKSFNINSIPEVCRNRIVGCMDDDGTWVPYKEETNTWVVWVAVLFIMALIMICTLYLYKRLFIKKASEEINQQVNINLAQYYAMTEQKKNLSK
ncbi:unnamed protein product [Paramecium sonneborni]|uniref:PA domain-containing protein n=1 Tax=Paramecium sonneborni TaxID=65129 RepID=A0A8S1Q0C8_9CILI|nr:unnamed protein product [Paramecium sonneborni]